MPKPVPELVLHLEDVLSELGPVTRQRFFGGWSFSMRGARFAYVLREKLFFPVDEALRAALVAEGCRPFEYEKGGRTVNVARFHEAPESCLDDPETLLDWAARAARAAGAM